MFEFLALNYRNVVTAYVSFDISVVSICVYASYTAYAVKDVVSLPVSSQTCCGGVTLISLRQCVKEHENRSVEQILFSAA